MIKPLTSLRFGFAFMVFLSHCILFDQHSNPFLHHLFFEGFVGVSFFFILRGFILAYNYQKKIIENRISVKKFYLARFARIYPLHFFTLLIWIWIRKGADIDQSYTTNLIANIFLLQSFFPMEGVKFNHVSWSLSDEMFFYLLFPFLIIWFVKSKKSQFIFIIFLIIIMVLMMAEYKETKLENWLFYFFPPFRLIDFMLGILLYNLCERNIIKKYIEKISPTKLEISAILLVILFYTLSFFIPLIYRHAMWYWMPICILIGVFYFQRGAISRFLSYKNFILLGEISFSFYMFHTMVLWYTKRAFVLLSSDGTYSLYPVFFIALIISLIVSCFSYKFIEISSSKYLKNRLL